jgi:hypothetical protein
VSGGTTGEHRASWKQRIAAALNFGLASNVGPHVGAGTEQHLVPGGSSLFDGHDPVGAAWNGSPGHDTHRAAGLELAIRAGSGWDDAADGQAITRRHLAEYREAVHGRDVRRGNVDCGCERLGEHLTQG